MVSITINDKTGQSILEVDRGSNLLEVLRKSRKDIYSPCGGNGTCGKCRVFVKGEGTITACGHHLMENIEIILPDEKEASVLVSQHKHTRNVAFNPGPAADLAHYPFGVAIDIGTTSLVFYLVNLITGQLSETRSRLNSQSRFGADVISRINYCMTEKDGLNRLQDEITQAINSELEHLADYHGITGTDIVKITIAGNATMLHLLLGVNPESIALAPFTPVFTEEKLLSGNGLGLSCHPEAKVKILPSVASYVGADIVSGIASVGEKESVRNALYMDIGTNGEIALITPGKILCCATAAGPAFEGANISCGMGAVSGAISAYDSGNYTTIGNAPPEGVCGSGLVDIVAYLLEEGLVDKTGLMEYPFIIAPSDRSGTGANLILTAKDIREVQLAKAAIAAGVKILLDVAGLKMEDIDCLYLAGGFGNYIHIPHALKIGLLPASLGEKVVTIGNASGTGAVLAIKSENFDMHIKEVLERSEYIELSFRDDFNLQFAMEMNF